MTFQKRIHLYGHVSAQPAALAQIFGAEVSDVAIAESDLAIFAINPSAGVDQPTIDLWQALSDFQLPRMVLVNELAGSDSDFEDAVMLANRVFDQLVTPYLVLHSDIGEPIALISLDTLEIIDYRNTPPQISMSEPEHQELVSEFRSEYLEEVAAAGDDAFVNGLLFPAIPVVVTTGLGVDIAAQYIELINTD